MKRRIIITCLLLCLLALACLCVSASADSSVTLADSVFYDEGYTIVTWSVDGAAPSKMYLVYEQIADDGGTHPMLSYGEVSGTRCSTVDLLPGKRKHVPGVTDSILDAVDTLVDGPFILEQRDLTLKFRGSKNQRILEKPDIARLRGIIEIG